MLEIDTYSTDRLLWFRHSCDRTVYRLPLVSVASFISGPVSLAIDAYRCLLTVNLFWSIMAAFVSPGFIQLGASDAFRDSYLISLLIHEVLRPRCVSTGHLI
jgi:hypothetical protein